MLVKKKQTKKNDLCFAIRLERRQTGERGGEGFDGRKYEGDEVKALPEVKEGKQNGDVSRQTCWMSRLLLNIDGFETCLSRKNKQSQYQELCNE